MKAVAYSIKPFEKEFLAKANQKRHDITLISNPLSLDTAAYAAGKDAAIVFTNDDVSAPVIEKLASLGVKYIVSRSTCIEHIDKEAAKKFGIKLSRIFFNSAQAIAEHTVAMAFTLNRHLAEADRQSHNFDFSNDELIGFNFSGKTLGVIGLGETGQAVARIFNGIGCKVIGYDLLFPDNASFISLVTLQELLATSDVIMLNPSVMPVNKHLIDRQNIKQMKPGVMLIDTSGCAIINTRDVLDGLESGKIGYLGLDMQEYAKGLPSENNGAGVAESDLLKKLLQHSNVLITPNQAYLTKETLQEIADQTIKNLDLWQENKCVGDACAGHKDCK